MGLRSCVVVVVLLLLRLRIADVSEKDESSVDKDCDETGSREGVLPKIFIMAVDDVCRGKNEAASFGDEKRRGSVVFSPKLGHEILPNAHAKQAISDLASNYRQYFHCDITQPLSTFVQSIRVERAIMSIPIL